jgi:hypothetical protein
MGVISIYKKLYTFKLFFNIFVAFKMLKADHKNVIVSG